ncbi:MAG: TolC family protein [Candidatus Obscuribacter phosphatis]|uniref:TolC family protein n=1 Tax=Candidatus Obscuribacter phosphatis TaxID=1906157 RepID=A0A8J7PAJ9_9BACT|nr:TolC family protein [Candidatus Obscuribacter phosphatis]
MSRIEIKKIISLSTLITFMGVLQAPAFAKSWFHPLKLKEKKETVNVPKEYDTPQVPDTIRLSGGVSAASISWRRFFSDPDLVHLIETALANNQEFNIALQDIEIAANEVQEKQGEYLPKVGLGFGGSYIKPSENTPEGVLDKIVEKGFYRYPDFNLNLGPSMSWEVDIWRRLRNAKDAARMRMAAQYEVRNFLISRLVTEIARNYYELMALDTALKILDENISIQEAAFLKMQILKRYGKSNQLAVNRFEAQLNKTRSQRFETKQNIVEKENRLKFLSGIYNDGPIVRHSEQLMAMPVDELQTGVSTQLLENRADIRQAEAAIKAAKLDLKSVKAQLLPNLTIRAGVGFSGFSPQLLFHPESLFYNAIGDVMVPLINRKAILARIKTADALQTQAVLNYEQTLLKAYTDVLNQVANIKNMQQAFEAKRKEVILLEEAIVKANSLFKYAKATYIEVLLTQEEKLIAEKEQVEVKMNLIGSKINLYRALGGGWR